MTCTKCKRKRDAELSDNSLELISEITQLNDIHDFMDDEQVDRAMHLVIKLVMEKGHMPAQQAPRLIVELQALATKFAVGSHAPRSGLAHGA